jgi:hypothetical protein
MPSSQPLTIVIRIPDVALSRSDLNAKSIPGRPPLIGRGWTHTLPGMMKLLPLVFAVQGAEDDRWLAVAPSEQPPGRMFDRQELRAADQGHCRPAAGMAGTIKPDPERRADLHGWRRYREGCDLQPAAHRQAGTGYIHFPIGGAFDETYFAQLTAETVQTRYKEGRPYRVWVLPPGKANEALDTAVYALAARHATRVRL